MFHAEPTRRLEQLVLPRVANGGQVLPTLTSRVPGLSIQPFGKIILLGAPSHPVP